MSMTSILSSLLNDLHKILVLTRYLIGERYDKNTTSNILTTTKVVLITVTEEKKYDREEFISRILNELISDQPIFNLFSDSLQQKYYGNLTDNQSEIMKYLTVLIKVITEAEFYNTLDKFDRVYDLLDAVHSLPVSIYNSKEWRPRYFWSVNVKQYREKWQDKNFLSLEENQLEARSLMKRWLKN